MLSRFHEAAKILLTASPVWTLMTTAVGRAVVWHVVASTHGLQGNPGSTTTIIGEIIADTLSLGGNAGIKMNLNPNSTLHIREVALVR